MFSAKPWSGAEAATFEPSQRARQVGEQPISDLMDRALANPDLVSLAAGFVDQETLPVAATRAAFDAIWSDPAAARSALQYGSTQGYRPLREAIAAQTRQLDGPHSNVPLSADQIVITAGSNQLLHLIGESLLDPGDIVFCASPTYLVYLGTLGNIGARAIGIESDEHGMLADALDAEFQRRASLGDLHRVKLVYLVPYFDNPAGTTMTAERGREIIEVVRRWSRHCRIHIIADEAYRLLRYEGVDTPGLRCFDESGDLVVTAGTFSKAFSPGLRLGWGILSRDLIEPVCAQKGNIDFGSPNLNQHLMAHVLEHDQFWPQVDRIRAGYSRKMSAMLEALDDFVAPIAGTRWVTPEGGLYVWLRLPEGVDAGLNGKLFERALSEGVLYVPGEFCYSPEGQAVCRNTMRLSFGVQSAERIRLGIESLARAIQGVCQAVLQRNV